MKKRVVMIVLTAVLIISSIAMAGPIDKNSWILGGSVSFLSQGGDAYKLLGGGDTTKSINTIGLQPQIGYFVANNILIGALADYTRQSQGSDKSTSYLIGPTVAYYFNPNKGRTQITGSIYPYIEALLMFGQQKLEDNSGVFLKNNLLQVGGNAGIAYMISNAVALDLAVQFTSDKYTLKEPPVPAGFKDSYNGTSLSISLGVKAFVWK